MQFKIKTRKQIISVAILIFLLGILLFRGELKMEDLGDFLVAQQNSGQDEQLNKCLENCCLGKQVCIASVKRVIDGDTIKLDNGETVRYIGIDTPESVHPGKQPECLSKEASIVNRDLVKGKEVVLIKDVSDMDKYGRLLRYVYLEEIFVNEFLVASGFAKAVAYSPDLKYQTRFEEVEQQARKDGRGIWKPGLCD